jgi:hypothetical protein
LDIDAVLTASAAQIAEIDDLVFDAKWIEETALGKAAMQRHLAAFA